MDAPFGPVPRNARGHFVLYLYAAIYRLICYARQAAAAAGRPLDEVFERYPFLAGYLSEMRPHMPQELTWDRGVDWWNQSLAAWEGRVAKHLPLQAVGVHAGLDARARIALVLIGLVEEDSRFGNLLADLQQPLLVRRPTLELVGRALIDPLRRDGEDPWSICRPLISAGLVEVQDAQAPRSEWLLRVPPIIWDLLRGDDQALPRGVELHAADGFPKLEDLIVSSALVAPLAKVPEVLQSGQASLFVLRASVGSNAAEIAGAIARSLGQRLLVIDAEWCQGTGGKQPLGALAALLNAMPCFAFDLAPGATASPPALTPYGGAVAMLLGREGGIDPTSAEAAVTLELAPLNATERERHWQRACGPHAGGDLGPIAATFRLEGHFIAKLGKAARTQAALAGRSTIALEDVRAASKNLNRQLLDALADPVPASGSWDDLVAAHGTKERLRELAHRCRYREQLAERVGSGPRAAGTAGVRALFSGVSGTGKTLAARVLAAVLGKDLYRVDLASVVNKYIGETEKNLHRVLSRAEALDVVLLIDEGDALLASRTALKSANDRYANLETDYLLQRLEHYRGIVVVTTNLAENIDPAFQRRMDVVVPFVPPQPEERLQILLLHLPPEHAVSQETLERIALRCPLTGSQLRSTSLHAALMALETETVLTDRHLEGAVRSEYRKAGGVCPLDGRFDYSRAVDGGVGTFMSAFANS